MKPQPVRRASLHRARRNERGAALFMVVMVLTIVSAMGVYAIRAASQVDLAAGNNRRAVQAQYVATFGAFAAAAELADKPDYFLEVYKGNKGEQGACVFTETPTCVLLDMRNIWRRADDFAEGEFGTLTENTLLGDLSPAGANSVQGAFLFEVDELASSPNREVLVGNDLKRTRFYQTTALIVGQVAPVTASGAAISNASSGSQRIRAYTSIGPYIQ